MTQLGDRLGTAARPAPAGQTALGRARATFVRGELVTLPLLGKVWIELPGDSVVAEIEAAVYEGMNQLKLQPTPMNGMSYGMRRAAHTLAWAVREAGNHAARFGSLEEWLGETDPGIDTDLLRACDVVYGDVRERLDPMGVPTLTDGDRSMIRAAIEKKNSVLLRSYGVAMLSLYLLSTEPELENSPTPPSPTGT